jgi:hypothetical protein
MMGDLAFEYLIDLMGDGKIELLLFHDAVQGVGRSYSLGDLSQLF